MMVDACLSGVVSSQRTINWGMGDSVMGCSVLVRVVRRVGFLALLAALISPVLPAMVVRAAPVQVTNCGPSGSGSLTQAVADANSVSNATIHFSLDCDGIVAGTSTTAGKIVPSG